MLHRPGGSKVTWYSCGPTVYDAAHIGHARTYVCTDIVRRVLEDVLALEVDFAMGVTDVDDKIIARAQATGFREWHDMERMVRGLEDDFFADLDALHVRRPTAVLRVTEHIPDIIRYIEAILRAGRAYVAPDGVYFDVVACGDAYLHFKERGLPGMATARPLDADAASEQAPLPSDEAEPAGAPGSFKRDPRDFALWKVLKRPGEEPGWASPWGLGRPGWHIECSAVTHAYFGPRLDLHSGGVDLKFPHHTNEVAQCAAHNCADHADWVAHWLHTGHLYIEGRKMSKSLKNFVSIREYLAAGYSSQPAADFRVFCLQHKYHSSVHFSRKCIEDAAAYRRKIEGFVSLVDTVATGRQQAHPGGGAGPGAAAGAARRPTDESRKLLAYLSSTRTEVRRALLHDFDTPEVLRFVSYLVGEGTLYASAVANRPAEPLEPLLGVAHYVADLLGKLGVPVGARTAISVAEGVSDASVGGPSASAAQVLQTMVAFRTKVRASALKGFKGLKAASTKSLAAPDVTAAAATMSDGAVGAGEALKEVLEACDWLRDTACPAVGVQIDDVSDKLSAIKSAKK